MLPLLRLVTMATMNEYQCWFCGRGIERSDIGAVLIAIEGLWRWDAGSTEEDASRQAVYAHSACAKDRLRGATMQLETSIFGEDG